MDPLNWAQLAAVTSVGAILSAVSAVVRIWHKERRPANNVTGQRKAITRRTRHELTVLIDGKRISNTDVLGTPAEVERLKQEILGKASG